MRAKFPLVALQRVQVDHTESSHELSGGILFWKWLLCELCSIHCYTIDKRQWTFFPVKFWRNFANVTAPLDSIFGCHWHVRRGLIPDFLPGDSRQHFWGALGVLQTWHILWDQRSACLAVVENFQGHQVSASLPGITALWVCLLLPEAIICLLTLLSSGCPHIELEMLHLCVVKVLGIPEEPGCVSDELHEVHYQFALPAFPLHCGLCTSGHAGLWWKVISHQSEHRRPLLTPVPPVVLSRAVQRSQYPYLYLYL